MNKEEFDNAFKILESYFNGRECQNLEVRDAYKLFKKDYAQLLIDYREAGLKEQKLIKYLEDKISHVNNLINDKKQRPYGEELHLYESKINAYKDLLEKVKSGKYE